MKDFFEELFAYSSIVNEKIIQIMLAHPTIPLRARQLISHILSVHESWNQRMLGQRGPADLWKEIPVNDMHPINVSLHNVTKSIIANNEMNRCIHYKNSKGTEYTNQVQDILFHLINHGTHHRGQINIVLRNAGIEPVVLDFIFYKR